MFLRICLSLAMMFLAGPVMADTADVAAGFMGGAMHGYLDPRFIVPLAAFGFWATLLGRRALFILPLCFPIFLALGGLAPTWGYSFENIETWVTLSGVTVGLLLLIGVEPPLWVAVAITAGFAGLLGLQHSVPGLENMSEGLAYFAGIAAACFVYQIAGILAALLVTFFFGPIALNLAGAAATAFAVYTLSQVM